MEYFLDLADEYVFDSLYAKILPAASFIPSGVQDSVSALSAAANGTLSSSFGPGFKSLLSYVPHPPLPLIENLEGISAWPRNYMLRQYVSLVRLPLPLFLPFQPLNGGLPLMFDLPVSFAVPYGLHRHPPHVLRDGGLLLLLHLRPPDDEAPPVP